MYGYELILLAINDSKIEVVWFSSEFKRDGDELADKLAGGVQVCDVSVMPPSSMPDLGNGRFRRHHGLSPTQ